MGTLDALFSSTKKALLITFFQQSERKFYIRELIRLIGKGQGSVQREVQKLLKVEIIKKLEEHGRTYYKVNKKSPIYPELKMLILKTEGLVTVLQDALKPVEKDIDIAFIFGSLSRGTAQAESDVDLAVIGPISFEKVISAIRPKQNIVGREINPVVLEKNELIERHYKGDHFINELIYGEKTFIIGSQSDFKAMAG